jgi:single-strand DNA-binding protein
MNQCILMAEVIQDPQLRYTPDQMAIAEMTVQFSGARPDDPPAPLKVVGWGNLAQEIQERYHTGDRLIIEGRLTMNTIERPEGFKEKRAELTAQRVHKMGVGGLETTQTLPNPGGSGGAEPAVRQAPPRAAAPAASAPPAAQPDFDDIPF